MTARLRHIIDIVMVTVLLAGLAVLLMHCRQQRRTVTCTALSVEILDQHEFVTQEDIERFLVRNYGNYIGQRIDSIGLSRIENLLESRSIIMESEAWTTQDGILHVSIVQRAPAVRFQRGSDGFYMDETGFTFPLHSRYTADVPLIEGEIPMIDSGDDTVWRDGILELVRYVARSRAWKDRIESMKVDAGGDISIRFKDIRERFIIGQPEDIPAKFARIDRYISRIQPTVGEGYYKSVNVKYNNQSICRKDI